MAFSHNGWIGGRITGRALQIGVVQLAPIMTDKIAWKTYFVCSRFNVAFIPCIYFFPPETNGHKLETLDAIFTQAHEKGENLVFTERRYRKKGATLDVVEWEAADAEEAKLRMARSAKG